MKTWLEKRWAVVGFGYEKACQIISEIEQTCGKEISKQAYSRYEIRTYFSDGTQLMWVRASESSRGYKFGKMWCDKDINKRVLDCVILPCYFGKREDIIWL